MKLNDEIKCPICGDVMEKYIYDYNTIDDEKINYKCPNCGHRESKFIIDR